MIYSEQAARATSAALTYFESQNIDGVGYFDAGVGYNNPAEAALAEAQKLWPGRPIGCFIRLPQVFKFTPNC